MDSVNVSLHSFFDIVSHVSFLEGLFDSLNQVSYILSKVSMSDFTRAINCGKAKWPGRYLSPGGRGGVVGVERGVVEREGEGEE